MKTNSISAVLVVVMASLLTGCVGILPIPPVSTKLDAGRVIERREASFIVPGSTMRPEVEQRLGPCSRDCPRAPSVAYSWERPGWTVFWWVASTDAATGDNFPIGGWHALFVAFDDEGIVLKKDFVNLSNRSLDDQLERWAERVHKKNKARTRAAQ